MYKEGIHMKIRRSIKEASTELLRDIKEHPWKYEYDSNDEESKQIYEEVCEELRRRQEEKEQEPERIRGFLKGPKLSPKEETKQTFYGFVVIVLLFSLFAWICIDLPEDDNEYQDSGYIAWFRRTSQEITLDILDPLGKAAWNLDYEIVGVYGEALNTKAKEALKEIDRFKVSSKLTPSKNEFKLALLDWEKAGYYSWRGAKNFSGDDLNLSADYMESAIWHWDRANALLP